jgi:hypothetical protein
MIFETHPSGPESSRVESEQPKGITDAQDTIRTVHGCESKYCRTVHIGKVDGITRDEFVMVFDLVGHMEAECCYAWKKEAVITTALNIPPVDSPEAAIRIAMSGRR